MREWNDMHIFCIKDILMNKNMKMGQIQLLYNFKNSIMANLFQKQQKQCNCHIEMAVIIESRN